MAGWWPFSPAAVPAAEASLVVTSLPSAAALGEVLAGLTAGSLPRAGQGGGLIVVETSTLAPEDKEGAAAVPRLLRWRTARRTAR